MLRRKLQMKFVTNGSKAIVVPRSFAADIADKYGSMKRSAKHPRTSLVYRTTADGKRKPAREKPNTIVRVQVNMPQPTPIVKVQETRVIRERVVFKEPAQPQPNVPRERAEQAQPVTRERIVEREKPVIRERIVEREKPPIVRERIIEREKPPIIRERIIERDQAQANQDQPTVARARLTDARTTLADSNRLASPIKQNRRTSKDRRALINRIFNEHLAAREVAFRLIAEAANHTEDRTENDVAAEEHAKVNSPDVSGRQRVTAQSFEKNATAPAPILINARKGSREPTTYKQQRVRVVSRTGKSQPWSAVVMINRRNAERLRTPDKRTQQPNVTWKFAEQQQAIERYMTQRLIQQARDIERRGNTEREPEGQGTMREHQSTQPAHQQHPEQQLTVKAERRADVVLDHAANTPATQSTQRDSIARTVSIDTIGIDPQLLASEAQSIEQLTLETSSASLIEPATPVRLRVIGKNGMTVRLLTANAEKLGSTLLLRRLGDAAPTSTSTSASAPASIPSSANLILRKIAERADTYVAARRSSYRAAERSTQANQLVSASPATPTAPIERALMRAPSKAADRIAQSIESEAPPSASRLMIASRTTVRRMSPAASAKQSPRVTPAGTIVHASQRWLAAIRRAEQTTRSHTADSTPGQQPIDGPRRSDTPGPARQLSRAPELVHREPGEDPQTHDSGSAVTNTISLRQANEQAELQQPTAHDSDTRSTADAGIADEPAHAKLTGGSGTAPTLRFTFRNRPNDAAAQAAIAEAQAAIANAQAAIANAQAEATQAVRQARLSRPVEPDGEGPQRSARPAATLAVRREAAMRQRTAPLIQRVTASRAAISAAARIAIATARQASPLAASLTRERAPMTMLTHPAAALLEEGEGVQASEAMQLQPPMTTLRHQQQPQASRASVKQSAAIPAPAAMELRRNAPPPVNAPPEPAPPAVVVEAPPQIDAKQLQKVIESMPELNPDQLADKVYASLMKKMKFEQRLRGY